MRRCALLLLSPLLLSAQAIDPAQGLVLSNSHVRFEFEPSGMGLKAMVDLKTGRNHIQPAGGKHLLWELAMARGVLSRPVNNNYKPCNHARIEKLPGGAQRAVLEWNELRWWLEDKALTVRVTVDLPADSGIASWRILVDNYSDYWGLQSVSFPAVSGFLAAARYDIARPVFASGGHLLKSWNEPVRGRHPSGGWPMQFFSLHAGRDSVYVGTRDPDGRAKDFAAEPGKQLSVIHHPENLNAAGSDFPDHYPVEFGVFQGAWVQAARHYRQWALAQKWASAGKLSQRAEVPPLARDAALWICESWLWKDPPKAAGLSTNMAEWVTDQAAAKAPPADPAAMNAPMRDALRDMGVPMALHWYNWHETRFDNNYPHFLPAKKGFAERVKELTSLGMLVMPYINGSSADLNIADWARFAPHAIQDEAGGYRMHHYSESAGRLLSMCPSQVFWQDTIVRLVERLIAEEGVNGVYVDQISAMQHELCFNPRHGHPTGGGRYWVDGNRDLLRKVRNAAKRAGRQVTITSEGADEMFLDLLDSNLTWAQPTDWEIPLMPVVYSGYTLFFGSPCDYNQSDAFFRFGQGQALIDGRQNGWMNLRLFQPQHARKVEYLRECARIRARHGKYLTYGQLLEPVEPLDPLPTFTEDAFGWGRKHRGTAPAAEARLWKAEDGKLAVFLVSYVDQPVTFRFRVRPADFGVAGPPIERREPLPPAGIKVIELP